MSVKARVEIKVEWKGPQIQKHMRAAAARGLSLACEELLRRSNERVPHDVGFLEDSGDTHVDERTLTGYVFYDTPYAVRLHEHPEYNFQGGREGKWLEKTANESGPEVLEWLAGELRKEFG